MFGLDDAVAHVSALALANRMEYDLGNGVWTGDEHKALKARRSGKAEVVVNTYP